MNVSSMADVFLSDAEGAEVVGFGSCSEGASQNATCAQVPDLRVLIRGLARSTPSISLK